MAAREAESEATVKAALGTVVHFAISVLEGEGVDLADEYQVGTYYPVFILTDSAGAVITRWTGYTGADRFIQSFTRATSDLTTIDARAERFETSPSISDGLVLAGYYSDAGEHLKARDCYRRLKSLPGDRSDYSYSIFKATAEAVWDDQLSFDTLLAAADTVLSRSPSNHRNLGQLGQIMGNVARRTGHTDRIEKYLKAGARATASRTDQQSLATNRDLVADYALYVFHDTVKAISIKKQGLGKGWDSDPERYYQYGEFCLQRGIDLDQAEYYIRMATNKASDGKFKAMHLRLLAEILYALGRVEEAILTGEEALDHDPTVTYFERKLTEWRTK